MFWQPYRCTTPADASLVVSQALWICSKKVSKKSDAEEEKKKRRFLLVREERYLLTYLLRASKKSGSPCPQVYPRADECMRNTRIVAHGAIPSGPILRDHPSEHGCGQPDWFRPSLV